MAPKNLYQRSLPVSRKLAGKISGAVAVSDLGNTGAGGALTQRPRSCSRSARPTAPSRERARRRRAARALSARQRERHAAGVRAARAPRRGGTRRSRSAVSTPLALPRPTRSRALSACRVVVGAFNAAAAASACRGRAAVRHPRPQRRQRRSSARRARSGPRSRRWCTGPRRTATGRVPRAGYAPALARLLRRR